MLERLAQFGHRSLAQIARTRTVSAKNPSAIVSFTFDDVPESAATVGSAILAEFGAQGTFYIAGGLCGSMGDGYSFASIAELKELDRQGHELGCHTYSHVRTPALSTDELLCELKLNQELIMTTVGDRPLRDFAYPFGAVSLPRKLTLQQHFASCRGTSPGLNAGTIDLGLLRAERLYDRLATKATVLEQLDLAVKMNGWLIYYTHDVQAAPTEYGVSPELLRFAVASALERGIEVLPVRNALARVAYGGG